MTADFDLLRCHALRFLLIGGCEKALKFGSVVKWISHHPPKVGLQVRFLPEPFLVT